VATGKAILIDSTLSASGYEWSPDSKAIAAFGTDRSTRKAVLVWVDVGRARSRRVDWTIAGVDYEIDWSPDSQSLAFTRPISVTKYGDLSEADLWIAGDRGGKKCCVLAMPEKLELHPRWFGPQTIRITSAPSKEPDVGPEREGAAVIDLVIELNSPDVAAGGGHNGRNK
jgi:dipeptidyl aminopeptidase/acylaminoacyl peptidase